MVATSIVLQLSTVSMPPTVAIGNRGHKTCYSECTVKVLRSIAVNNQGHKGHTLFLPSLQGKPRWMSRA
eukprot:scaffold151365_cov20-Tisochrysis_lutea.AAC.1